MKIEETKNSHSKIIEIAEDEVKFLENIIANGKCADDMRRSQVLHRVEILKQEIERLRKLP